MVACERGGWDIVGLGSWGRKAEIWCTGRCRMKSHPPEATEIHNRSSTDGFKLIHAV